MDPKSKFSNTRLDVNFVLGLVEQQQLKGNDRNWSISGEELKDQIIKSSKDNTITYFNVIKILNAAHTSKMHGLANKGLGSIKESVKMHAKDILKEQDNETLNERPIS